MDDLDRRHVERLLQLRSDAEREYREARLQLAQTKERVQRVAAALEAASLAAYTRDRGRVYERAGASASTSLFEEESSRSTSSRSGGRGRVDFVDPSGSEVDRFAVAYERLTNTRTTSRMRPLMARIWQKLGEASLEILERVWNEQLTTRDLLKRVYEEQPMDASTATPIQLEPEDDLPESAWSLTSEEEDASNPDRVLW